MLLMVSISTTLVAQDNVPPSTNPPGGLTPKQVPMFVSIGCDDNYFSGYDNSGGMKWLLDYLRTLKNPAGSGQSSTYDGTNARCTFFNIAKYADGEGQESSANIKKIWNQAYIDGHELGNHTYNHPSGNTFTVSDWVKEILDHEQVTLKPFDPNESTTSPDSSKGVGITKADYYGFRTPYLHYSVNLFKALDSLNYVYDCSIEEGWQSEQDGSNLLWPYTLDNGSPGHNVLVQWGLKPALEPYPGLWELPVYVYVIPPDELCEYYGTKPGIRNKVRAALNYFDVSSGKIVGSDYNLLADVSAGGASLTKDEILATYKYTFDLHYYGNRVPFLLTSHTTYYSSNWTESASIPNVKDRQWITEEFLKYVLTKPEVRIVPYIDIIDWMRTPSALAQLNGPFKLNINSSLETGSVNISPIKSTYNQNETVTLTATPAAGYEFAYWHGGITGTTNPITITMNTDIQAVAIFRKSGFSCDSTTNVFQGATFSTEKDNFGSTVSNILGTNDLQTNWTLVKRTTAWPWLSMIANFPINLYGLCSLSITYKSDKPIVLSLPQAPLSSTGESYMIQLPATASYTTITKAITDFAQPAWATNKIALDLGKVNSIAFAPDVDTEAGSESGTFSINNFVVYGVYIAPTSIAGSLKKKHASINIDEYNNLIINKTENDTYKISCISIDGKLIFQAIRNPNNNNIIIPLNKNLASGIYVIKVETKTNCTSQKIFIGE